MLARPFQARRQPHQVGLILARGGEDRDEPGLPLRERARLVDHDRVHPLQGLQRLGVLDQDARQRPAAGADHDRHRRGQAQGTGAGDDQHGHGVDQGVGHPGLGAERGPGDEGDDGDRDHGRHKVGGDHVGQALDRRPAALRLAHQPHDLGEHRLRAHRARPA